MLWILITFIPYFMDNDNLGEVFKTLSSIQREKNERVLANIILRICVDFFSSAF